MVENFTDFYDTFFEFSANIAYRIVKEKNISKDIAQEVFMYFLKEEDKLDYSDEECLRAKVHNKTRKVCLVVCAPSSRQLKKYRFFATQIMLGSIFMLP